MAADAVLVVAADAVLVVAADAVLVVVADAVLVVVADAALVVAADAALVVVADAALVPDQDGRLVTVLADVESALVGERRLDCRDCTKSASLHAEELRSQHQCEDQLLLEEQRFHDRSSTVRSFLDGHCEMLLFQRRW